MTLHKANLTVHSETRVNHKHAPDHYVALCYSFRFGCRAPARRETFSPSYVHFKVTPLRKHMLPKK